MRIFTIWLILLILLIFSILQILLILRILRIFANIADIADIESGFALVLPPVHNIVDYNVDEKVTKLRLESRTIIDAFTGRLVNPSRKVKL